jgi:hypothetical protein
MRAQRRVAVHVAAYRKRDIEAGIVRVRNVVPHVRKVRVRAGIVVVGVKVRQRAMGGNRRDLGKGFDTRRPVLEGQLARAVPIHRNAVRGSCLFVANNKPKFVCHFCHRYISFSTSSHKTRKATKALSRKRGRFSRSNSDDGIAQKNGAQGKLSVFFRRNYYILGNLQYYASPLQMGVIKKLGRHGSCHPPL